MGRWTQYDEDDHRLPEGMKRVGYDADTQQYTFRQGNQLWVGEPGARYGGQLAKAATTTVPGHAQDDDMENGMALGSRSDGYQALPTENGARPVHSNRNSYRAILPFMLLICIFLLFIWRFVVGHSPPVASPPMCGTAHATYHVHAGDSCWSIAQAHGMTLEALQNKMLNPGLDCDKLRSGDTLCMPKGETQN